MEYANDLSRRQFSNSEMIIRLSASIEKEASVENEVASDDQQQLLVSEANDQLVSEANNATVVAVRDAYPIVEILTMTLTEHKPLGCTVEESMDTDNDPSIVFISKIVDGGNAEKVGLQVGDVLIGVTDTFGKIMTPVWLSGVEKM